MVTPISMYYEASDSQIFQGKNVRRARKKGYYKYKGGNSTFRMNKASTAILTFEVDGYTKEQSVKSLIRDAYGIDKVGKPQADRFFNDVKTGTICLEYDYSYGLYIK